MTELLQKAITHSRSLRIPSRFLKELQDEPNWSTRFTSTTDKQWDRIAEMVRQEINSGVVN